MTAREKALTQLVEKVVEVAAPEKIVLFGSRARGQERLDSDVDLLVIAKTGETHKRAALRIRTALPLTSGLDIIVRSPRELRERVRRGDPFFVEVMRTGKTLYEKHRS